MVVGDRGEALANNPNAADGRKPLCCVQGCLPPLVGNVSLLSIGRDDVLSS